jgi:mercuric ion binding protein
VKTRLLMVAIAAALSFQVRAEPQTVTLSIPGMNCPACPVTIRMALEKIEGVEKAEISYEEKKAIVSFDDAQTSVDALTEVTADLGYPSQLQEKGR